MTNQEAIINLKVILSEIIECEESICYVTDIDAEPLRLAIKALEKQIPKKPICEVVEIKSERQQSYIRYLKCPNCKRNIDEENTVHFCTYCGQAIDWSDEI